MTVPHNGVLIVTDESVTDVPAATPWPAALANLAEQAIVNLFGSWPSEDDELWWPTDKAMQEAGT